MRTALIDGDVFVYEAARANEVETNWGGDLWTLHSFLAPAVAHIQERLSSIQRGLEADAIVVALSDYERPWRKQIMPSYKANRKEVRKPVIYGPLRDYVHESYRTFQRPGLEGDDVLGILLTHPTLIEGQKVVVSIDKDMMTLPGLHLNNRHHEEVNYGENVKVVTEQEADLFHITQALTGDAADGYPGCPGVGPVKAAKILAGLEPGEWWAAVVKAYEKVGLSEEVALLNARVARICRYQDYDFSTKTVKLWHP